VRSHDSGLAGFTLIELMIVVAIIGILASISLPFFTRFQMRSKAGEAKLNLAALRAAEASYFGEYGTYLQMAAEPQTSGVVAGAPPRSSKRAWSACPAAITMADPGYCIMGFATEGPTFYDYAVGTVNANTALGPASMNVDYFAVAESDIDGDGVSSFWGIVVPQTDGTTSAAPPMAGCPDVLDDFGVPGLRNSIGPCGTGMGHTIF
jgi:prepilin-type N-terminal cleavage/methylation domain-containing protein